VGKRPSFTEVATGRLRFLIDDQGFAGPEITEWPPDMPAVTRVSYHRSDVTIEVAYVVDAKAMPGRPDAVPSRPLPAA
jgi:hypothetical protein